LKENNSPEKYEPALKEVLRKTQSMHRLQSNKMDITANSETEETQEGMFLWKTKIISAKHVLLLHDKTKFSIRMW